MNIKSLLGFFSENNCDKVYVKRLSPNDNSKNQVYLGGNFDVLNILPFKEIISVDPGDWKRNRFKTRLDFFWVDDEGVLKNAKEAQLILYPKYPEVRFSGFLKGVNDGPNELMTSRIDGRILFFGISRSGRIIGYVTRPDSEVARGFNALINLPEIGVFKEINLINGNIESDSKSKLIAEIKRIHELGWIDAKRLDSAKNILPCTSSNCGGYTLEAELGVAPNGYAEPDYLGWEIKQFSVKEFNKHSNSVITLMTPEPTHGYYTTDGIEAFIRKYGYRDKLGRESRLNFGGIYKHGIRNSATDLELKVVGFDGHSGKITDTEGYIGLIDRHDKIAASWSFASLLKHWNTKHAKACYVPSKNRKDDKLYPFSRQQYYYGNIITLGSVTDFSLVLKEIVNGNLYYDPGIKLEESIEGVRKKSVKRRSQFRIKSGHINKLYRNTEILDTKNVKG